MQCFIYGLIDTNEPDTIKYVGSTTGKVQARLRAHMSATVPHLGEWFNTIGKHRIGCVVLEICDDK